MKIYKAKEAILQPREGYQLGILAEVQLSREVSSVGFFRPQIPPRGKVGGHYHEEVVEFMFFPKKARIRCGPEIFDVAEGDIAVFHPGELHEVMAGDEGISPLVVKLPNNPKDKKAP